ncbi:hypothetical protein LTS15_003852 [Exophiala xenobiotica]|nr:hypothetical protein LTS15_003852 [Exophiala xenobiotica]
MDVFSTETALDFTRVGTDTLFNLDLLDWDSILDNPFVAPGEDDGTVVTSSESSNQQVISPEATNSQNDVRDGASQSVVSVVLPVGMSLMQISPLEAHSSQILQYLRESSQGSPAMGSVVQHGQHVPVPALALQILPSAHPAASPAFLERFGHQTAIILYLFDAVRAIMFDQRPELRSYELQLPLPCDETIFAASTEDEWQALYVNTGTVTRMEYPAILSLFLCQSPTEVTFQFSVMGAFIVLHDVAEQRISAQLADAQSKVIDNSLRLWRKHWDSTVERPGSMTSTGLYRDRALAYWYLGSLMNHDPRTTGLDIAHVSINANILENVAQLKHCIQEVAAMGRPRIPIYEGDGPVPMAVIRQQLARLPTGHCTWFYYGTAYGPAHIRRYKLYIIDKEFMKVPGARRIDPATIPANHYFWARHRVASGVPDLHELAWLNWRLNGAHAFFSPVSSITEPDANKLLQIAKRRHKEAGLDMFPAFCVGLREMHLSSISSMTEVVTPPERLR